LLIGGGQEGGFRSGTEATPAIWGFAAACEAVNATLKEDISNETALLQFAVTELCKLDGVVVNGVPQAPHILSLAIPGVPTQNSINILQDAGICVSAGSACAKGHRSHVLTAMNISPNVIDSAFRVSLSRDTTKEDIDALIAGIQAILNWKNR